MTQPKVENRRSANDIAIIVMSWIVLSFHILGNFDKCAISNWHGLYRSDWKTVIGILFSRPWDFCLLIYCQFLSRWIMSYLFFIGGMNSFFSLKRYEVNRSITLWAMVIISIKLIRYFHINPYFHFNRKTEWEFRKERFNDSGF